MRTMSVVDVSMKIWANEHPDLTGCLSVLMSTFDPKLETYTLRMETDDGGVSIEALYKMFGTESMCMIMKNNTVHDATDKLKAYEDKNSDRIEVGDEVEWDGDKYVVTYLNYDIETSEITDYDLLAYDGSVVDHVKKCTFTKTGKRYDIASILEAMRE